MHYKTVSISCVSPNDRNARTHSKRQIQQIASSIEAFGFVNPLLVDEHGILIAGHGRLEAASVEVIFSRDFSMDSTGMMRDQPFHAV